MTGHRPTRADKKVKLAGNAEFEYRIVRPDGSIRWIKSRGFPVRDDAGKIVRITGVAEDITERKKADQKFKDLLESAPDAMVIVNRDAEMVLVNSQAVNLFGWRYEGTGLGQNVRDSERFRPEPETRLRSGLRNRDSRAQWNGSDCARTAPNSR